jgi:hypothetical protein
VITKVGWLSNGSDRVRVNTIVRAGRRGRDKAWPVLPLGKLPFIPVPGSFIHCSVNASAPAGHGRDYHRLVRLLVIQQDNLLVATGRESKMQPKDIKMRVSLSLQQ